MRLVFGCNWFCRMVKYSIEKSVCIGSLQTYEEGLSVSKYVNSRPLTKIHSRLAYIGSSCLLKMMLVSINALVFFILV